MTTEELHRSAREDDAPPAGLTPALHSLWLARAGRWHEAHELCTGIPDPEGAWIHAHLHREEGDLGNASYWYRRAKRSAPPHSHPLDAEWRELADHFVAQA